MKKQRIILLAFLCLGVMVYIRLKIRNDDIIDRLEMTNNLFNTEEINPTLVCYVDFLGPTIDGSRYEFYKYELNGGITFDLTDGFPEFTKIYDPNDVRRSEFSFWQKTPIPKEEGQYFFQVALSSNLTKSQCSRVFKQKDLLRTPGNYYSYVSGYPIGTCILVYAPLEKCVYIITKK